MTKNLILASVVSLSFLLTSCMRLTPAAETGPADYGSALPVNYQEMIIESFPDVGINVTSSVYKMATPFKGTIDSSRIGNLRKINGWIVCGSVNQKNTWAGYRGHLGFAPFVAVFKNGMLADKLIGNPIRSAADKGDKVNVVIQKICTQRPATETK